MKSKVGGYSIPVRKRIIWISDIDLDSTLHASTWIETTKSLRELGWEVHLITAGKTDGVSMVNGTKFLSFKKPDVFFVKQLIYHWRVFRWYVNSFRDGSIILFHEISGIWCRMFQFWCKFTNRGDLFVIDTRTLPMEPEQYLSIKTRLRRAYLGYIYKHADRWFDGHTVITKAMAESLDVPSDKLWATWQSGVNLDLFRQLLPSRKFPEAGETIRLIYVGSMHVERNLHAFCEAVVLANESGCRFRFVLVGGGTQFEELAAYAKKHDNVIEVHPSVAQAEIPSWLAESHIGVLPFPDEEKFRVSSPIKLFEYMASGMPILATQIRCHTDVIETDEMVFWAKGSSVEDFVAVLEIIEQQRGQLTEMGRISAQFAENFTWEASARGLSDGLLEHIMDGEDQADG